MKRCQSRRMQGDAAFDNFWACPRTLDGDATSESGWWTKDVAAGQWLAYDLGHNFTVGHVCLNWGAWNADDGTPGAEVHGAQSVRLDASRDGAVWETGVVYTSATSGLDAGTTRSASLEASCFNISAVTSRYVRLFLGAGATAGWIGVGEVGFKCEVEATPAPTAAPITNNTKGAPGYRTPPATASPSSRTSADSERLSANLPLFPGTTLSLESIRTRRGT